MIRMSIPLWALMRFHVQRLLRMQDIVVQLLCLIASEPLEISTTPAVFYKCPGTITDIPRQSRRGISVLYLTGRLEK
jgi:hypothetical protein